MKKVEKKAKPFMLCAFYYYEVDYLCNYCYLNEDGDFVDREIKQSFQIEGGRLMENISKLILDNNCTEFYIQDNEITISHFDCFSGETSDYVYTIKELPATVFDNIRKEK